MSKHYVWHADEVKNFGEGAYESRLLLDSKMAGEPCINVNHGTVAPGAHTGDYGPDGKLDGPAHEKSEIYFCVSGRAIVYLDGEPEEMHQGSLIYIPAGTHHCIENLSKTEKFVLLTMWPDERDNEAWVARKEAWGEGYEKRRMDD